jgi:hypothetical protein
VKKFTGGTLCSRFFLITESTLERLKRGSGIPTDSGSDQNTKGKPAADA